MADVVVNCECGAVQCLGNCDFASTRFSDQQPGNVQRMEKTKHKHGVWAAARALIFHEQFPSLIEASKLRLGSLDVNREQTKFQYAWRKWKSDVQALCEKPNLPPSCERMVRVLHFHFEYDMQSMLQLSLQIARAVIELELRRSEEERGVHSPCSDAAEAGNETALMTRVRSAMKHKEQDLSKCIERFIQTCYPVVARVVPTPPLQPPTVAQPLVPVLELAGISEESVSAAMQQTEYGQINDDGILFDLAMDFGNPNLYNFGPTSNVTLPTEERDNCQPVDQPVEYVPGLINNSVSNQGDPLFSVVQLCEQGEVIRAVQYYKSALQCGMLLPTSEQASAAGLTPWYYMWLKLGDEIKRREVQAEKRGLPPRPRTSHVLCALDPVFAELECDRDYGEFGPEAEQTLNKAIANGNFAAKAIKGLLMLGAEADVGGKLAYGNQYGDNIEAREYDGLQLVVEAMKVDQWTVPRFLVQLIKDKHVNKSAGIVRDAINAVRKRADTCSITSFHLGALLSYEMAVDVGYIPNVNDAKAALQSCLDGVYVCSEIRLQCTRKLGRLVTFGVGGVGVDLEMAERVLRKGVEADDTFCMQLLANVRLRQNEPESAVELFQKLFAKDEWEVFISAFRSDHGKEGWETYRIHVLDQYQAHFLNDVRSGACLPLTMRQERVSENYGELMLIEFHKHGLKNT